MKNSTQGILVQGYRAYHHITMNTGMELIIKRSTNFERLGPALVYIEYLVNKERLEGEPFQYANVWNEDTFSIKVHSQNQGDMIFSEFVKCFKNFHKSDEI